MSTVNTLITFLINFWHRLSSIGTTGENPRYDQVIVLLNRASILTVLSAGSYLILNFFFLQDWPYFIIISILTLLYSGVLILHAFNSLKVVRYYVTIIIPIWYAIWVILVGGFHSQSLISATLLSIAYSLFNDEPLRRNYVMAYNVLIHVFAMIYININGPYLETSDLQYDEILVYLACIIWILLVLRTYYQSNKNLIARLKVQNEELENLTEEMRQFNYIASHDLKSPLRNVISFLGLIEHKIKRESYDTLLDDIAIAKNSSKDLFSMVNDILQLSKLNASTESQRQFTDLDNVINLAISNLNLEIKEKGAVVEVINETPSYLCNKLEFITVFQNLIQNGIKYNDSDRPKIVIQSTIATDRLTIKITDNGIGINPKYHDQVFTFFKRLHTNNEYKGTGLGLSICRKIIQRYRGFLLLDSEEGQGSTFRIILPLD